MILLKTFKNKYWNEAYFTSPKYPFIHVCVRGKHTKYWSCLLTPPIHDSTLQQRFVLTQFLLLLPFFVLLLNVECLLCKFFFVMLGYRQDVSKRQFSYFSSFLAFKIPALLTYLSDLFLSVPPTFVLFACKILYKLGNEYQCYR